MYNITLCLSNLSVGAFLIRSRGQRIETINHWDGKVDVREKFNFYKDLKNALSARLVFLAIHLQIIAKESWERKDPLRKTWGVMLCEMKGFDSFSREDSIPASSPRSISNYIQSFYLDIFPFSHTYVPTILSFSGFGPELHLIWL